jgi:hypothetical protein
MIVALLWRNAQTWSRCTPYRAANNFASSQRTF